uniref:Uncharacterized protein n=1 Tax=Arundo donax TaxID=35708 RepID=A0A0A9H5S6_ARUDO
MILLRPLAVGVVLPAASTGHGWCSVENAEIFGLVLFQRLRLARLRG